MLEILAYFESKGGKHLPNAMKKGLAKAFDRFDSYQLAKYRGENRAYKLIDVVNLVHPKPTERNERAMSVESLTGFLSGFTLYVALPITKATRLS